MKQISAMLVAALLWCGLSIPSDAAGQVAGSEESKHAIVERALEMVGEDHSRVGENHRDAPSTSDVVATLDVVTTLDTEKASAVITVAGGTTSAGADVVLSASDPINSVVKDYPGGVQVLTILDPDAQEATYTLDLAAGWSLRPYGEGFDILNAAGEVIGNVAPPWAVDAEGRMLPTRYRWDGRLLTQEVDTTEAVFPVVADPRVSFGWYIYIRYSKTEVKEFASLIPIIGGFSLVGTICGKIPFIALRATCSAVAAVQAAAILATFNKAASENKCVEIKVDWDGFIAGWKRYAC